MSFWSMHALSSHRLGFVPWRVLYLFAHEHRAAHLPFGASLQEWDMKADTDPRAAANVFRSRLVSQLLSRSARERASKGSLRNRRVAI